MNVIRTILIIVAIYYALRFIGKIVAPFLLRSFIKKAAKKGFQNQQGFKEEPERKKGDVRVESRPKRDEPKKDNDAEYVDFEEID